MSVYLSLRCPTAHERITPPLPPGRLSTRMEAAACCALAGHILFLGLVVAIATRKLAAPADPQGFALILTPPEASRPHAPAGVSPAQERAPAPAPAAEPGQQAVPPLRQNVVQAAKPRPTAVRRHREAGASFDSHAAPADTATATGSATQGPPAAPPQTPPAPDVGPALAALEAKIDESVRRQATMPPAAARQRREGRAQVRFNYVDGTVEGAALAQSSQSRLLDDAALKAVRTATYPAAPAALRGRRLALLLWIDFHLQS